MIEWVFLFVLLATVLVYWLCPSGRSGDDVEGFVGGDGEPVPALKVIKRNQEIYDDFYAKVYDRVLYNKGKNTWELEEIELKTMREWPGGKDDIYVLDVGCGSGHHVVDIARRGYKVVGLDRSRDMVHVAQRMVERDGGDKKPVDQNISWVHDDVLKTTRFREGVFTHILCLYFTVYYMHDLDRFFENCRRWLRPGGWLVVHAVNKHKFDPIVDAASPFPMLSLQKYTKKRITSSAVHFKKFRYDCDFALDSKNTNRAYFKEIFTWKPDAPGPCTMGCRKRRQTHTFFMPDMKDIVRMARNHGFVYKQAVDMGACGYSYQYLLLFTR